MSLGEGKYTRLIDKWSRKFWMNFPKNEFPPLSRAESRKSVLEISGKVLNLNKNVFAAPPLRLSNQIDSSDVRPIRNGRFRFQTPVRRARIVRILAVKTADSSIVLSRPRPRPQSRPVQTSERGALGNWR